MFASLGLFQNLACPEINTCTRPQCIFSHRNDLPPPPSLNIPVDEPQIASSSTQPTVHVPTPKKTTVIPAKRAVASSPLRAGTSIRSSVGEPPRKLQKLDSIQKPLAVPSTSHTTVRLSQIHGFQKLSWCADHRQACLFSELMLHNLKLLFLFVRFVKITLLFVMPLAYIFMHVGDA